MNILVWINGIAFVLAILGTLMFIRGRNIPSAMMMLLSALMLLLTAIINHRTQI